MCRMPALLALTPALSQREREQNRQHCWSAQKRSGLAPNALRELRRAQGIETVENAL